MLCTPLCTSDLVLVVGLVAPPWRSCQVVGLVPSTATLAHYSSASACPQDLPFGPPFMIIASGQEIGIPCGAGREAGSGRLEQATAGEIPRTIALARFSSGRPPPNRRTAKDSRNPPRSGARTAKVPFHSAEQAGVGGRILGISTGDSRAPPLRRLGSSRGQRFSEFRGESASSRFSVQHPARSCVGRERGRTATKGLEKPRSTPGCEKQKFPSVDIRQIGGVEILGISRRLLKRQSRKWTACSWCAHRHCRHLAYTTKYASSPGDADGEPTRCNVSIS